MRKALFAGVILMMVATTYAQTVSTPQEQVARVAVIDISRVGGESTLGKSVAKKLEALQQALDSEIAKKQAELQKMDDAIKGLQEQLAKQESALSEEARERLRQDVVRKGRERQAFLEDGQAELQRTRVRAEQDGAALRDEFQQKIRPHIDSVARQLGIDLVVDAQWAHAASASVDITGQVVAKVDEAEKVAAEPAPQTEGKPIASGTRRP